MAETGPDDVSPSTPRLPPRFAQCYAAGNAGSPAAGRRLPDCVSHHPQVEIMKTPSTGIQDRFVIIMAGGRGENCVKRRP
jgi:hypothetical protein